jgi:hypothetical protein
MRHTTTPKTGSAFLVTALLLTFGLYPKTTPAQTPDADPGVLDSTAASKTTRPRSTTPDPMAILRSAKTIYVKSSSLLVGEAVIEDKLRKRSEFQQLGLAITREWYEADLVLELKHDLFTMYVYTVIDPKSSIVVASGKLSSLGGTVAGKVAKRFMKQMVQAHSQATT